jgi:hypothetical protein
MWHRQKGRVPQCIGLMLVAILGITSVTSSVCEVCLSKDLRPGHKTFVQSASTHQSSHDCDRDGCDCCGFQFVGTVHQTIDVCEFTALVVPISADIAVDYPSDFYRPPRA